VCKTQIKPDLNDNKKFLVEDYKNSIYKSTSKSKPSSASKLPFKSLLTTPKISSFINKSNENLIKKDLTNENIVKSIKST
jgi:hypothetical protein